MCQVLKDRGYIRIVDVYSGIGVAGYALSKILLEHEYKVKLTLIDIRKDILLRAREWIKKELNIKPIIHVIDAKTMHTISEEYDIALMWGSSSPHFNPWDMNKLLASISYILNDNGLFIMQEADRFHNIITRGYRDIIYVEEEYENKMVLDVLTGYDPLKGTYKRRIINLKKPSEKATLDLYYWSIAGLSALLWIFFRDIDVIEIPSQVLRPKYIILAHKPRKTLSRKISRNLHMYLRN